MTTDLYPTKARLALLVDVDADLVADDEHAAPHLNLGADGSARVADAIWQMKQAGWVHQPDNDRWQLTDAGRDVLEAGAR